MMMMRDDATPVRGDGYGPQSSMQFKTRELFISEVFHEVVKPWVGGGCCNSLLQEK